MRRKLKRGEEGGREKKNRKKKKERKKEVKKGVSVRCKPEESNGGAAVSLLVRLHNAKFGF